MGRDNIINHEEQKDSTNSKIYTILGNPTPLARARHSYARRMTWDSQKHDKLVIGMGLQKQHGNLPLYRGPLFLEAWFYFSIPLSRSKKIFPSDHHFIKPDIDNLVKFILDVGNTILFNDDCQIAIMMCKKEYANKARTEFKLTEMQ